MRYFPHTSNTVDVMLKTLKVNSLDDLFASIPHNVRLKAPLNLPQAIDELSLKKELAKLSISSGVTSFLGCGATAHFVPEWVSQQLMRAEWYTAYTPYQPEASQGTLQAIFEFQSMVASLFGLEIANASMYDGATALVEALLMAIRVTNKKTIILSKTVHPEYRETVRTYLELANFRVIEVGFLKNGLTDVDDLAKKAQEFKTDLAAIAVQSPNFFGNLEAITTVRKLSHDHGALFIGVMTDMTSSAIINSFGSLGADIAVGDGLGLLGGLHLGGPGVGLFAIKNSLLRQMPGRLVGMTRDKFGKRGFVLTLSTREQHIRREKATSNICTNHNLMALAFSMTLSAYGKSGFFDLAKTNLKKTLFFRKMLRQHGLKVAFFGPHYNETVIDLGPELKERLGFALKHKMIAGLSLEQFYPELPGHLLVSTTELHDDRDIKKLAAILSGGSVE